MKLLINSHNELRIVELDEVVYMKASGNYTEFHFANNQVKTELLTLSAAEQLIESIYENKPSPFFRMGRSYLINTSYLSNINLQRQTVKFISGESLVLPKHRVKELKESIVNGLCSDVKS